MNPRNHDQKSSPSYLPALLDDDYLLSDSMRGVRFLLEYSKAEEWLKRHNIQSTIVVFGSARVSPDDKPERARWYHEARAFGRIASQRGGALHGCHCNVIATGGGPGVMEAANRGAMDAGAPSIGFNITLPHEQEPNPYSTPDLTFQFHYFAMRKMHLAMRARALVIFPGGFGTLDEMFEILTLQQTGKMPRIPTVIMDKGFWTRVINFDALVEMGTIAERDLELFRFSNDAEHTWQLLLDMGLELPQ